MPGHIWAFCTPPPRHFHYAHSRARAAVQEVLGNVYEGTLVSDFYVAFNAWSEALKFRVPPSPTRRRWRRLIDTALPSPDDFVPEGEGPVVAEGSTYTVAAFGALVLISEA